MSVSQFDGWNKMSEETDFTPKILILPTIDCSDPGADYVGQQHLTYSPNAFIMRTRDPVIFSEEFYIYCFEQGFDGVMVASCGTDCPFEGAYPRLAKRIDSAYQALIDKGISYKRLSLTAVCTVCSKAFITALSRLEEAVKALGPISRDLAS